MSEETTQYPICEIVSIDNSKDSDSKSTETIPSKQKSTNSQLKLKSEQLDHINRAVLVALGNIFLHKEMVISVPTGTKNPKSFRMISIGRNVSDDEQSKLFNLISESLLKVNYFDFKDAKKRTIDNGKN